jgi:hypothetical protein
MRIKAYYVELHGNEAIIFATTRNAAKFGMVRPYWSAYGKTKGFPPVRAVRAPEFDDAANIDEDLFFSCKPLAVSIVEAQTGTRLKRKEKSNEREI